MNSQHNIPNAALGRPTRVTFRGDARDVSNIVDLASGRAVSLPNGVVDLIVTSPPYWKKRDYGFAEQIGQEATPDLYVESLMTCFRSWKRLLRPTGSIFLNVGDTYFRKSLVGIPGIIETAARAAGWKVRNRIIWVKKSGMPDPARDRLASRHEYVIHFAMDNYFYDLFGYSENYSVDARGANPGDVWILDRELDLGAHLAPFPTEIARRAIMLACPAEVCSLCGEPRRRIIERTQDLDVSRPQARRAIELAAKHNLSEEHFEAIRATGISDAGKARRVQTGTDRNTLRVQKLAAEAKEALGGYFREFTFAKKRTSGWSSCNCRAMFSPGVVFDPFMGTGTTLNVALELGRSAIGIDLSPAPVNLQ